MGIFIELGFAPKREKERINKTNTQRTKANCCLLKLRRTHCTACEKMQKKNARERMNARKKTTIYCQGQSQYVAYDFEFANARTSERCETIVIHYEKKTNRTSVRTSGCDSDRDRGTDNLQCEHMRKFRLKIRRERECTEIGVSNNWTCDDL